MLAAKKEYLTYLNENGYLQAHNVSDILKKNLTEDVIGEERDNLLIEIKCFEFFLQNGDLKPIFESIDKEGNRFCYPDLSKFTEDEIEYLESRLNADLSPFPKARYAHLLWKVKKHQKFGVLAAEAYKSLLSMYLEVSLSGTNLFYEFCNALESFHHISASIKYEQVQCKEEVLKWLKDRSIPLTWKDNIVDLILASPLFKQTDLLGLTELMLSFEDSQKSEDNYFTREKHLKSCLELSQKEGVSNTEILNLLGQNELDLANKRADDQSGMILISCYRNAAYYFKLAGNIPMYDHASNLYTKQKSNLKLSLFQYELPPEQVQILNDEQNGIVDKWLATTDNSPLWHLVYSKGLLMTEKTLKEEAHEDFKNSFMYLASMQVYDLNNNAKSLGDDDEKLGHQKFQNYSFHIQLSTISIVEKFLYKGIRTGKLSRNTIMTFFYQTWLAKGLEEFTSDEKPKIFRWIDLLAPGLFEIVTQLEAQILDKNYSPNFLLGIDSLSIKIEGIIRDLARLSGKSVTKIKEGEAIEMNLDELLRDDQIMGLFKENDLLFFKYLLTKQGWNTRNNVAHSFYRPSDYHRTKAILLLLAVFRLCKYDHVGQI